MAKKKAVAKKATKKVAGKREKAKELTAKEEELVDVVDEMTDEEIDEVLDPSKEPVPKNVIEGSLSDDEKAMVSIAIPVTLKIKRKIYNPGTHEVPSHVAQTMLEMVDKKRKADISIFTGKNFVVERILDRSLVIRNIEPKKVK